MTTANICSECGNVYGNYGDVTRGLCGDCLPVNTEPISLDDDALLDALVEKASIPNLAAALRKAREQGLITPTPVYS